MANAIRALSMDAVERAQSGHPGMPMGMADIAQVLWHQRLRHNPLNPEWVNRDRFVLSNGHGSLLLYSLLHLTGYALSIDDIKQFRQWHSKTPGHPEYGIPPGVETTTGPLGQGIANAVGMAIAERSLAYTFNREPFNIIDHYTYVFAGDGCLMEGISHEACSLAGTLGLHKLIAFWDDNGVSIDGRLENWFTDDTIKRFAAYGWHTIGPIDGHDHSAIRQAILEAEQQKTKPTLIAAKTIIGYGAPNMQGSHKTHGAPLGKDEIQAARQHLGWPHEPFSIPPEIYHAWDAREKGSRIEAEWQTVFNNYQKTHPTLAAELLRRIHRQLPIDWSEKIGTLIQTTQAKGQSCATRKAQESVLNELTPLLPELLGGSADLSESNNTLCKHTRAITPKDIGGNYLHYGVREFAMSAIANGIALHRGFIPFCGTFLVFSDYARNAVRLSALMKLPVIFIYSHDSIGLGEDGPTHQPIEHLNILRMTPQLSVWRPTDDVETAVAWQLAIERHNQPTCILLSRQKTTHQERNITTLQNIKRGGYILKETASSPNLILIATGSEVGIAAEAFDQFTKQGHSARLVSMPSTDTFEAQPQAYRDAVLPPAIQKRVVVEAGHSGFWHRYVGNHGSIMGIDRFGESAPGEIIFQQFGFTAKNVVEVMKQIYGNQE